MEPSKNNSLYMHATLWLKKHFYTQIDYISQCFASIKTHSITAVTSLERHNVVLCHYPILHKSKVRLRQVAFSHLKMFIKCLL